MRILWVKTELLHPIDKGGRIRSYQMLRSLLRRHHIVYVCLDDGTADVEAHQRAQEYCSELITVPFHPARKDSIRYALDLVRNLVSPLPYAVGRYRSKAMRARIAELIGAADVLVCDFLAPSQNVPDQLGPPTVLFQHNVEAMIWERRASVARGLLERAYLRSQWQRMRRIEAAECRRFGCVIAVSDADADVMQAQYALESVASVPTGVDLDYFANCSPRPRAARELLFVGSMDWMPNEDGIRWFIEAVYGLVRAQLGDVALTVVGRMPSRAIRRLAELSPGITITGTVPDVRPYLHRAAVSVVPLRVGGGTRIKIYEAMAAGLPVVSTLIGAEGLPLTAGEHLLIGDSAQGFADAIIGLLIDSERARLMADSALRFVRRFGSWDAVSDAFIGHCLASRQPRHSPTEEAA